jgi:hypothetical protein
MVQKSRKSNNAVLERRARQQSRTNTLSDVTRSGLPAFLDIHHLGSRMDWTHLQPELQVRRRFKYRGESAKVVLIMRRGVLPEYLIENGSHRTIDAADGGRSMDHLIRKIPDVINQHVATNGAVYRRKPATEHCLPILGWSRA